jgi:hypothetical protein
MRAQVTVTVNEAKRIIAKGISRLRSVRNALKSGKIFLKGGTTVSCVSEEVTGKPLRISGRIVPDGTKTAQVQSTGFHCALIEGGKLIDVDDSLERAVENLKAGDVAIMGANAIDVYGNAALMYGAPLGAGPGRIISALMAEIENIIIAAGLEKLVPGSITDIVPRAGRKDVNRSMGMAIGLVPLAGRIVTEKDAISLLGEVDCTVVGRGGLFGAEGATTMIIEGDKKEVENVFQIILSLKGEKVSGTQTSLPSCTAPHERCKIHRACIYKKMRK